MTCYLHPEMPGKLAPCVTVLSAAGAGNDAPELPLPISLVLLSQASNSATELCSLKPVLEIRPQNFCCLQAWFSQAKLAAVPWNCAPWSLCRKSGPRAPATQRFGSWCLHGNCTTFLEPTSGKQAPELLLPKGSVPPHLQPAMALGSPEPASKSYGSCCLLTWVHLQ
jgi:hypothetical protein